MLECDNALFMQFAADGGELSPFILFVVAAAGIGDNGVLLLAIAGDRQGPSEFGAAPPLPLSLATDDGVDERLALFMLVDVLMHEAPSGTLLACEIMFGTNT